MRQPRRDGPGNPRNQPDGMGENQREHDATITYGCGNSVEDETRGQLRTASSLALAIAASIQAAAASGTEPLQ